MKKYRPIGLGFVALLLAVALGVWLSPWGWKISGWMKEEPFYQGMPTSYWRQRLQAERFVGEKKRFPNLGFFLRMQINPDYMEEAHGLLLEGGPEAVPVLIELLRDNDSYFFFVCQVLGKIGPEAKAAVPDLLEFLKDQDPIRRLWAACALSRIDPSIKAGRPILMEALKDKNADRRKFAAEALRKVDPETARKAEAD